MNDRVLSRTVVPCVVLAMLWLGAGCTHDRDASAQVAPSTTSDPLTIDDDESVTRVERVVFIGVRNACACTRTRVEDSFAALQTALDGREDVEVLRLNVDVDETEVAAFAELRRMIVLPAIYLLDGSGDLVDMLQGEVTAEQIRAAVGAR